MSLYRNGKEVAAFPAVRRPFKHGDQVLIHENPIYLESEYLRSYEEQFPKEDLPELPRYFWSSMMK